jgi:ribosome maturation factor RimP
MKSVGREVVAKTASGDEPVTYRGMLAGASDSSFTIEAERGTITVPYEDLVSARTVFRWEKAPKPGH